MASKYMYTIDAEGNSLPVIDNGALRKEETAVLALNSNKLGGKEPEYYQQPVNLLDNSSFQIAQAGYNGKHGTQDYACDRWLSTKITATTVSNGLKIDASAAHGHICQKVTGINGKALTFAAKITGSSLAKIRIMSEDRATVLADSDIPNEDGIVVANIVAAANTLAFLIYPAVDGETIGSCTVQWAALYEGTYTAETLPPYVPKGYVAELLECQRYYYRNTAVNMYVGYGVASSGTTLFFTIFTPVKMRISNPTIAEVSTATARGNGNSIDATINSASQQNNFFNIQATGEGFTAFEAYVVRLSGNLAFSADL